MQSFVQGIVSNRLFERSIIALILLNGVILGLETDTDIMAGYGDWLKLGNQLVLAAFVIEAAMKIYAVWPTLSRYFGNGWNVFDFSIVVISLVPEAGEWAMLARLARLLRVLRLVSTLPELRLIVATLVRSIPSMGHVIMLMSILFYIYAVAGFHLFHQHDPEHWRSLGIALLTLFRIVTLEDWTDVMYRAMEMHHLAWMYFVSFVIFGTFVIINLFIAVVLNNLEESKAEHLREMESHPPSDAELLEELHQAKEAMERLERRIKRREDSP